MFFLDAEVSLTSHLALIVYRIWFVLRVAPYGPNEKTRLSRIIRVLVESGLMYTTSIVILFVMYVLPNNAQYAVSDAVSRLVSPSTHVP